MMYRCVSVCVHAIVHEPMSCCGFKVMSRMPWIHWTACHCGYVVTTISVCTSYQMTWHGWWCSDWHLVTCLQTFAGRGFSALPILTSAAVASKPHLTDHTPFHKDPAQATRYNEFPREGSPSSSVGQSTDGCPEDALFPGKRSGAASLFLGDCLNAKPKQDQTQSASASNYSWPLSELHTMYMHKSQTFYFFSKPVLKCFIYSVYDSRIKKKVMR